VRLNAGGAYWNLQHCWMRRSLDKNEGSSDADASTAKDSLMRPISSYAHNFLSIVNINICKYRVDEVDLKIL
jgi:hypothetical protein